MAQLAPDVSVVTRALKEIPLLLEDKVSLEIARIFRTMSLKTFRAALADMAQDDADTFAEALDGAGPCFTQEQQDQITAWTGLTITAQPLIEHHAAAAKAADAEAGEVEHQDVGGAEAEAERLDALLAELREEVDNPEAAAEKRRQGSAARKRKAAETQGFQEDTVGRAVPVPVVPLPAVPSNPAAAAAVAAARQWAASRGVRPSYGPLYGPGLVQAWQPGLGHAQRPWAYGVKGVKGGKGRGPRPYRSCGIASLDESARLHGLTPEGFQYGQLARYSDRELHFGAANEQQAENTALAGEEQAEEDGEQDGFGFGGCHLVRNPKRPFAPPPVRLPKGTPTLAPMCPVPEDIEDDL